VTAAASTGSFKRFERVPALIIGSLVLDDLVPRIHRWDRSRMTF
jgi:hypothetical protein